MLPALLGIGASSLSSADDLFATHYWLQQRTAPLSDRVEVPMSWGAWLLVVRAGVATIISKLSVIEGCGYRQRTVVISAESFSALSSDSNATGAHCIGRNDPVEWLDRSTTVPSSSVTLASRFKSSGQPSRAKAIPLQQVEPSQTALVQRIAMPGEISPKPAGGHLFRFAGSRSRPSVLSDEQAQSRSTAEAISTDGRSSREIRRSPASIKCMSSSEREAGFGALPAREPQILGAILEQWRSGTLIGMVTYR